MRKNCTRFKLSVPQHNWVSLAQTCRHSGHANRDRLMTSTRYVSTACRAIHVPCRGSGSEDSDIHTKLFTSGRKASLWQVTRTIMGSWRAMHQCWAPPWLGRCLSAHPVLSSCLVARCMYSWLGSCWKAGGCQGCPTSAHSPLFVPDSHRHSPQGRTAGKCELLW